MTGQFISAGGESGGVGRILGNIACFPGNAVFFAGFYACLHSSRVSWSPELDPLHAHVERRRKPLIYYAWHGDSWLLIGAVLALPQKLRPVGVCNDGVLSRLNSRASSWLGIDMFEYARGTSPSPRRQLIDFMRLTGRHLMIFPDAGGPYRQLKPGMLAIAREADADLVPVSLDVKPAITVGRVMRHRVPTPFARLRVNWGMPLTANETNSEMARAALLDLGSS